MLCFAFLLPFLKEVRRGGKGVLWASRAGPEEKAERVWAEAEPETPKSARESLKEPVTSL